MLSLPRTSPWSWAILPALYLGWIVTSAAYAQTGNSQLSAEHIPNEAIAVISAWPKQLAAKERMQLAPLEVISAAGVEQMGFDPLQIERLDVMLAFPGPFVQFGVLVQLSEAFDIQNVKPEVLDGNGLQTEGDFSFLRMVGPDEIVIHQVDEKTFILGAKIFAKQMVSRRNTAGQLATLAATVGDGQDALAIVSINTLRPLLLGMLDGPGRQLPPSVAQDLNTIVQSTEFLALRLVLDEKETLQLVLSGTDAKAADAMQRSVSNALAFGQQLFVREAKNQIPTDTATGVAMHRYLDRLSTAIVGMLTPRRSGNRLVLEMQEFQNISVIGTLTGLLLPAVQAAREAARRQQSSNNLKQIGLALHNFHDAYRAFPATAGLDDQGQPLISWRVAILPFVEEQALYEQFHLDEPWDSDHNIQLLEKMPAIYRHPSRPTQPGYTVYQATVGDKTLLRQTEPTSMSKITDGTSNTIMAVETTPDVAVPWTAPEDYAVNEEQPKANLFVRGITQALFGDGSVQVVSQDVDEDTLKALYTRAGGEVVRRPNF